MKTELQEKFELYETPNWVTESIFKLYSPLGKSVIEPGCNVAPHCNTAKRFGAVLTTTNCLALQTKRLRQQDLHNRGTGHFLDGARPKFGASVS